MAQAIIHKFHAWADNRNPAAVILGGVHNFHVFSYDFGEEFEVERPFC